MTPKVNSGTSDLILFKIKYTSECLLIKVMVT